MNRTKAWARQMVSECVYTDVLSQGTQTGLSQLDHEESVHGPEVTPKRQFCETNVGIYGYMLYMDICYTWIYSMDICCPITVELRARK